ncbi:MAG: hypothetical protein IJX63_13880, partial [Lachnospiraceae bacterium]|nr:hypothetical protein [Lachnospiraceae bacterium]
IQTKHEISNRQLAKGVPIIMLTANAILSDREKYIEEGFDDFLSKPILVSNLEQILLKHLSKELIVEQNSNKIKDETVEVDLPKMDDFNFDYALSLIQQKELLYKFLMDFLYSLDGLSQKLESLFANIEKKDGLRVYRSEVHALKSTAATVGALLLSQTARLVEIAAIDEDIERVRALHLILQDEIEKHKVRMKEAFQTSERKEMSGEIEAEYLEMLRAALLKEDFNVADFVCTEIQRKQYSEKIQAQVEILAEQIFNLQAEAALETLEQMKN